MNLYKIAYAKNRIIAINISDKQVQFTGQTSHYEHGGILVYALVKADTEEQAREMGEQISHDFVTRKKG